MRYTSKRFMVAAVFVAFAFAFARPASAEVTLEDLARRVEALEKENVILKEKLGLQETKIITARAVQTQGASQNYIKSKFDISLYGFIKADAVYSSRDMGNAGITQNNATRNAKSIPVTSGADDPETELAGQDTRLGLDLKAPELDNGGIATGKFEMDFAGSTTAGVYLPRLRLAYVQAEYDKWGVNMGQNWDIFAPLGPNTLNPGVLYRQGNLGTRHPQVNLFNKWGMVLGGKVATKVGVIDSEDPAQEDSGTPAAAAYASYEKEILGVKSVFGIGGMYGRLDFPNKATKRGEMYATTLGMTLQFTDWLAFKAEGYSGAGLNKFQGGSAQTAAVGGTAVPATTAPSLGAKSKVISTRGGFAELTYNPLKKLEWNLGAGVDDVNDEMAGYSRYDKTVVWSYNKTYYTNLKYSLSKELLIGLEFQRFQTKWLDGLEANDNRVETSMILKF